MLTPSIVLIPKWLVMCLGIFAWFSMSAAELVSYEFFVDVDPGVGKGTALEIGDLNLQNELRFDLPTRALSLGGHTLYIRVQDSEGQWSHVSGLYFFIDRLFDSNRENAVSQLEYFIGEDPGIGKGKILPFAKMVGERAGSELLSESVTNVAGVNRIGVRAIDSVGAWGHTSTLYFVAQEQYELDQIMIEAVQGGKIVLSETIAVSTPMNVEFERLFLNLESVNPGVPLFVRTVALSASGLGIQTEGLAADVRDERLEFSISGYVEVREGRDDLIQVQLLRKDSVFRQISLEGGRELHFENIPAGANYDILVYSDSNSDGELQADEPSNLVQVDTLGVFEDISGLRLELLVDRDIVSPLKPAVLSIELASEHHVLLRVLADDALRWRIEVTDSIGEGRWVPPENTGHIVSPTEMLFHIPISPFEEVFFRAVAGQ